MTHLVARLILTMLILPVAGAVFVLGFVLIMKIFAQNGPPLPSAPLLMLWVAVYAVIGIAWIQIWRPVVRWTPQRRAQTVVTAVIALAAGGAFGFTVYSVGGTMTTYSDVAILAGGGVPPIVWVLSTVLVWRENAQERTERLTGAGQGGETIVCPTCGYDMGASRAAQCPECGLSFTISELVAAQPHRALQALDDE